MKAAVRLVYSADVEVQTYVSPDPDDDGVWVRFIVGPEGGPGEESFDVLVCTPLWLRRVVRAEGPQVGRHHLIVDPFDLRLAIGFLLRRFEELEAPTYDELAEKLARLGLWEFEDYRET
ncbi:Imm8 family immunity protein [Kribbella sp. GL6]|uniref:Imm8 family immunity protein n=1 Tax=Kribbella sp. GL6 TaxID=3419765 RepID=UPI003D014617